jgi:hypothetical protein
LHLILVFVKTTINFIIIIMLTSLISCDDGQYMGDYTSQRPQFLDVLGTYKFKEQTIQESLTFKEANTSFITLKADGSFIANNILNLMGDTSKYVSKQGLIITTGRWKLDVDSVETSWGTKKPHWGIRLTSAPESISFIGFLGSSSPYELIVNYSDPDLNEVMLFKKK